MSKQLSVRSFLNHNENDSNKMNSNANATASVRSHGKFTLNKKSSHANVATASNKNSISTMAKVASSAIHNVSTASNGSDCMIIDDDQHGFSTVKNLLAKEKEEDDFLEEFDTDDLTFTKITTQNKKETCMEDLYAKYGSPNQKSASALDTFDIDKELNSNASYVNAIKKLDENMQQLRASPLKNPTTNSKFKFNVKSKPPTAINQKISPPAATKSSGFSTNFKTMGMLNPISKTSNGSANAGTFKPSTITSNNAAISTSSHSMTSKSFPSSFDTPVLKPYKPIQPVQSQSPIKNSSKTGNSSP